MNNQTARTDQKRVGYVLGCINDWKQNTAISIGKLSTLADSLPAMIRMNGLGQTMAFLKTSKDEAVAFEKVLSDWLIVETMIYKTQSNNRHFIKAMVEGDQVQYRQAQAEAMLILNWFKKLLKSESKASPKAPKEKAE